MGDVVNLNQYRKELAKQRRQRRAAGNRSSHGRDKHEREEARLREERRNKELDGKRLESGQSADEPPGAS